MSLNLEERVIWIVGKRVIRVVRENTKVIFCVWMHIATESVNEAVHAFVTQFYQIIITEDIQ